MNTVPHLADRSVHDIETFDIRAGRWFNLDEMCSTPRAFHGVIILDGWIYLIGGCDGDKHYKSTERYNPAVSKSWQNVAPMSTARCYISVAVLNSFIYSCGGLVI